MMDITPNSFSWAIAITFLVISLIVAIDEINTDE
jgi:hypothetical protein